MHGIGLIWSIIRRFTPENIHQKIKSMRALASMSGAVFDVEDAQAQEFEDCFTQAKEAGQRCDANVFVC